MKIAFVPIDNRPVCYQLPRMIAALNSEIEFFIPPIEFLGDLKKSAKVEDLFEWLNKLPELDCIILSLDTLAYGGLIPSRRCKNSFEEIKQRLLRLKEILAEKKAKIFAFSSVMRISNNNINEEEKDYWSLYGTQIFRYSYDFHKYGISKLYIPAEILQDYLATRKRNFTVNKLYLDWQKEGLIDTLIFSKDDCAEYGFNVMEAKELESLGGITKTGADEIPLSLLARACRRSISVAPVFLEPECKNLISNYEDISIEKSVLGQLELAGCSVTDEKNADVLLYVNNFKKNQGEIVMKKKTEAFSGVWHAPEKQYIAADVRFANGADNEFVKQLFAAGLDEKFLGYSAWNTSANTLGSLICAMKYTTCKSPEFKRLQAVRLLDDWAYQANVRQQLEIPDVNVLTEKMKPYEEQVKQQLHFDFTAKYSFPWERLFEVQIELS